MSNRNGSADPIVLAAQAREMLETLHQRGDTVVQFKTNQSGFAEDEITELELENPGHFRVDKKLLTLNLDTLLNGRPMPEKLTEIEDWRKYPILAGVAAHESAHARFSLWDSDGNVLPESIPNPDFDAADSGSGPEFFPVSPDGKLNNLARLLEEPRVERLGVKTFTKTWRRAMQLSAAHLIIEHSDQDLADGVDPLWQALGMMVMVGGRVQAGTLGISHNSRKNIAEVLGQARNVVEQACKEQMDADPSFSPYDEVMRIITDSVFDNNHTDATGRLEAARQILKIVEPENSHDPDGDGDGDETENGDSAGGGAGFEMQAALDAMSGKMQAALDGLAADMQEEIRIDADQPETAAGGGHGAVIYNNPQAPQIDSYEQPNSSDRELYRRAVDWMGHQIQPTVTEAEFGQWLPVGGARLDVRSFVRDNLANHKASQRSDWDRVSETVKPAPPVKVAVMLDGSGSMRSKRRLSASIAWAAANAAAQLPEARTVSVVFGAEAAVTQKPGHDPVRKVAVSRTDGPWENFGHAAELVESALWLDEPVEEGQQSNTLIIIVSDLCYGGSAMHKGRIRHQSELFTEITREWVDKGFTVMVIGADDRFVRDNNHVQLVDADQLFRV